MKPDRLNACLQLVAQDAGQALVRGEVRRILRCTLGPSSHGVSGMDFPLLIPSLLEIQAERDMTPWKNSSLREVIIPTD
jgi:hypothetical protein